MHDTEYTPSPSFHVALVLLQETCHTNSKFFSPKTWVQLSRGNCLTFPSPAPPVLDKVVSWLTVSRRRAICWLGIAGSCVQKYCAEFLRLLCISGFVTFVVRHVCFTDKVRSVITRVHCNQDQIWLVKIGEYTGFYGDDRS